MSVICDLYTLSNYSNIYIVLLEDQGLPEEDFWRKKIYIYIWYTDGEKSSGSLGIYRKYLNHDLI